MPAPDGGAAARLAEIGSRAFGGTLPVRIRAWDGSSAGPVDAPTLVVHTPAALTRLLYRPGELGLAQAYVTGEIDVEGDLLDGFRRVWRNARDLDLTARPDVVHAGRGDQGGLRPRRGRQAAGATREPGPAARTAALAAA